MLKTYTPEIESSVCRMIREGLLHREIAPKFNITKWVVSTIACQNGLAKYKKAPFTVRAQAMSMWMEGVKTSDIAKVTGMLPQSIRCLAKKKGFRKRARVTPKIAKSVADLHMAGGNDKVIANKLNISRSLVFRIRNKILNLPAKLTTSEQMKEVYRRRLEKHGEIKNPRWEVSRYRAWLEGAPVGLTNEAWTILAFIKRNGDTTTRDVAAIVNLKQDSIIHSISRLKASGFVKCIGRKRVGHHGSSKIWVAVERGQHDVKITKPAVIPEPGTKRQALDGTYDRRNFGKQECTSATRA